MFNYEITFDSSFDELMKLEREVRNSDRTDKEYFFFVMNKITELVDKTGDFEMGHAIADTLMVKVLDGLGYEDGTNLFKHLKRWYG